eukprot:TRINITY_DN14188_c0_g1_i1.p1 TRINITY_DN14188_c0_g1~~TRINITY_DN14188_c0_g1_i1.p1  ORF type:complete len:321 (+),score=48.34 TRINITY_DN14188_c0_g1_i1:423-1385(+)
MTTTSTPSGSPIHRQRRRGISTGSCSQKRAAAAAHMRYVYTFAYSTQPLMNTLIRGDYYGKEGRLEGKALGKQKPFGIVAKNKLLQGQSRLNLSQKRQIAKYLHARKQHTPQNKIDSNIRERLAQQETDYWSTLDGLNRKRRINFHKASSFGDGRCSPVALAMTDCSNGANTFGTKRTVLPAACVEPLDPPDESAELNEIKMDMLTPPGTPPGSPSEARASIGGRKGKNLARVLEDARHIKEGGEQELCAAEEKKKMRKAYDHVSTNNKSIIQDSVGTLARDKHHYIGITDHSHRATWTNPSQYADQRVPIIPYEQPRGL